MFSFELEEIPAPLGTGFAGMAAFYSGLRATSGKSKIKNQNAKIQIKYQKGKLGLFGYVFSGGAKALPLVSLC